MATQELPFEILRFLPTTGEEKKGSAIIVLQEWWGVNDQIKKHAQFISDKTQIMCVVPDLYKGKIGLNAEEASHLMNNLNWKESLEELEKLSNFLKNEGREKIGVVGFCMGGAISLALGAKLLPTCPLSVVITCYGIPQNSLIDISKLATKTPVQGHFANKDIYKGFSDPPTVDTFENKLKESVKGDDTAHEIQIYRYENQDHAFLNDDEQALQERKEAQDLAWKRIFEFFKKYLG
ncbi:1092_t:CDS:1 [Diversispora eburnea]|uniref:1092_t:CDS:1 n=1 Tax=Diversispora eburnea TaxID=1213867 RepID=A0A9N9B3E4_9GLOM|nr:1092_t:CDS:1 [Diversispora eburnea]